jgi:hypothetical protein
VAVVEVRVRWWLASAVAVGISVAGAVADLRIEGALRWAFAVAYAVGCLAAVLGLSGAGLGAAMLEPPVVAVLAVGVATVATGHVSGGSAIALAIGARLTAVFPVMAGMTGATVLVGLVRLWRGRGRPVAPAR